MNNICFNDGYKEYTINNDPTKIIRFNPADWNIIDRIAKSMQAIEVIAEEMSKNNISLNFDGTVNENEIDQLKIDVCKVGEVVTATDKKIKEQINYIFDSNVSDMVFGEVSCLALVGGIPLYQRFIEAALPVITADIESSKKTSDKRISQYTQAAQGGLQQLC